MEIGWSALWFVIAVSLLVTVHEFGHFWMARRLGFKVQRFSVGFGKPLLKFVGRAPDRTEYVVAALPLGGYVRMLDERDGAVPSEDLPRSFTRRPPWQRIVVLLAGPAANILFAIMLLWGMFWFSEVPSFKAVVDKVVAGSPAAAAGLRPGDEIREIDGTKIADQGDASFALLDSISDDGEARITVRAQDGAERSVTLAIADRELRHKLTEPFELFRGLGMELWTPVIQPILGSVDPAGPAGQAGLKAGDLVTSMDGRPVHSFEELADYVHARPGQEILLTVRRAGVDSSHRIRIASATVGGKTIGRLMIISPGEQGALIPENMKVPHSPGAFAALRAAVEKSWQLTAAQGKFFVRMLTNDFSSKNISGFISIAKIAGDSASAGTGNFMMFLVLISLSLGFLNLLPIPILDGGQIVFQIAEWAKGGPLSERTYMVGQQAGLLLLVLLMGVALFNDLSGIFAAHS